jgi:hypothetical protein
LRLLLGAVDELLRDDAVKTETVAVDYESLQIEHVIPRAWRRQWSIIIADPNARMVAEQRRERYVDRIGDLTLASSSLNPSMSDNPWAAKRVELAKHSVLRLNALLLEHDHWNEDRVADRGRWLAEQVDRVWPGPDAEVWDL